MQAAVCQAGMVPIGGSGYASAVMNNIAGLAGIALLPFLALAWVVFGNRVAIVDPFGVTRMTGKSVSVRGDG